MRETLEHWAGFTRPRDVEEVIALVGLEGKPTPSRQAVGGQQRRLDLALALVGDPELVFLDEPTTGFDPAARRAAWDVIRALRDLGKTVLLTTHYLDEAQALADRVAIIKDGRILAEGAAGALGERRGALPRRPTGPDGEADARETDDPTTLLHELTGEALARGERLEDLSVTRPSLEEVYLELTAEATLTSTRSTAAARRRRPAPPRPARGLAWRQYRLERKMFWRNPSAAFFNFLLPLLFLGLFGAMFVGRQEQLEIIVPGIAGMA